MSDCAERQWAFLQIKTNSPLLVNFDIPAFMFTLRLLFRRYGCLLKMCQPNPKTPPLYPQPAWAWHPLDHGGQE